MLDGWARDVLAVNCGLDRGRDQAARRGSASTVALWSGCASCSRRRAAGFVTADDMAAVFPSWPPSSRRPDLRRPTEILGELDPHDDGGFARVLGEWMRLVPYRP
jgi:hypothetical protein